MSLAPTLKHRGDHHPHRGEPNREPDAAPDF